MTAEEFRARTRGLLAELAGDEGDLVAALVAWWRRVRAR